LPGLEGLPGGEPGRGPAGRERGAFPPAGFLGEQRPEHLDRFPALRLRGRDHLGCMATDVGQPEPAQQRLDVSGNAGCGQPPTRACALRPRGTHVITSPSATRHRRRPRGSCPRPCHRCHRDRATEMCPGGGTLGQAAASPAGFDALTIGARAGVGGRGLIRGRPRRTGYDPQPSAQSTEHGSNILAIARALVPLGPAFRRTGRGGLTQPHVGALPDCEELDVGGVLAFGALPCPAVQAGSARRDLRTAGLARRCGRPRPDRRRRRGRSPLLISAAAMDPDPDRFADQGVWD